MDMTINELTRQIDKALGKCVFWVYMIGLFACFTPGFPDPVAVTILYSAIVLMITRLWFQLQNNEFNKMAFQYMNGNQWR